MLISVLGFLAILGPLVVVHEFGHFIFAKLFNVKAEIFSVGFGPKIFGKKWGETEFRVAPIPLGGYVKLLGEEPDAQLTEEEKKRSLQFQEPWKRFFIFLGGPLFNFIFAVFVFMAILVIGEPQVASVIGRVEEGTPADRIGLRGGDRIVSVDGKPIDRFNDFLLAIHQNPEKTVRLVIDRPGEAETRELEVIPERDDGYSIYGERKQVGVLRGISPMPLSARIGISNPSSVASQKGLLTGDFVLSFNGKKVNTWDDLVSFYGGVAPGAAFDVEVGRVGEKDPEKLIDGIEPYLKEKNSISFVKPGKSKGLARDFGIWSAELFVEDVKEGSPAAAAGIRSGDRLVSVNKREIQSFSQLREEIQSAGAKGGVLDSNDGYTGSAVTVQWERSGKIHSSQIMPTGEGEKDPDLNVKVTYTIGVMAYLSSIAPETVIVREWNPFKLVYLATERMITVSWRNLVSLGKMVTGDVSVKTLGGPILIGKIAGDSLARGLISFLTMMGVLSVGLGILNILPIPVLDGGHLLLLTIESIRKKPLSIRQMEIVQQVGLTLILLLMVIVMKNDISRIF